MSLIDEMIFSIGRMVGCFEGECTMPNSNPSALAALRNDAVKILIALDDLSRNVGIRLGPEMTAAAKLGDLIQNRIDGTASADRQPRRRSPRRRAA